VDKYQESNDPGTVDTWLRHSDSQKLRKYLQQCTRPTSARTANKRSYACKYRLFPRYYATRKLRQLL